MFFRRKVEKPYTLGEHMEAIEEMVTSKVSYFPPPSWFEDFNKREEALREQAEVVKVEEPVIPPTPLVFEPHSPSVFYDTEDGTPYRGQDAAKTLIDVNLRALRYGDRFKCLLVGPAGVGKTTLARIIARRLSEQMVRVGVGPGRFFSILPDQIGSKEVLDRLMQQVVAGDIIFIDEIHVLKEVIGVTALYNVLADGDAARYPLSNGTWVTLPKMVHWVAATTDPGSLDATNGGALNRRLQPEVELQEPTPDDLVHILHDQEVEIHPDAAYEIAERSGALPWQALLVYGQAKAVARSQDNDKILPDHATMAFDMLGLDENGLLPRDRKVLQVLLGVEHTLSNGKVVHKMSEAALTAASGVDRHTYKDRVQPKLMRMNYLTTVNGQSLTDKALRDYAHLKAA